MSIKADKWIRRMAAQHGMISQFEPKWESVCDAGVLQRHAVAGENLEAP